MSRDEIEAVVTAFGDLARIDQHADPQDRAEIYAKLRLTLTDEPEDRLVQAVVKLGLNMPKGFVSEEQGLPIGHASEIALTSIFVIGDAARTRW